MLVETTYSMYREAESGLKLPSVIVQKRGGWPTFEAQILGAEANPANIQALLTPPPPPAGRGGGPGGYNAVAVEFADHILLFEGGPQNEARALANFAEVKRVIPNKPIRYAVISHHHFELFKNALAAPRTLAPDAMSKSSKKPVFDPVVGDKRVFQDATRTAELHVMNGLPHADGMLMLYLPKEKILGYADTYNAPAAGQVAPRILAVDVMMNNINRLGLDFDRVVSVHAPNPNRPITKAEIVASLAQK